MTDSKHTDAETLLAKLHDCLWGSAIMEDMRDDQVGLMEEVAEFIRQRGLDTQTDLEDSGEDLVKVHVSNIGVEGRNNPGESPISTDETVLLQDRAFYAMSPVAERPFVTVIAQDGDVVVLFPRGVPDEFKALAAADVVDTFVNQKVNEATLAIIKASVLEFWRAEITAGRMTYLHWRKEWRMTPA